MIPLPNYTLNIHNDQYSIMTLEKFTFLSMKMALKKMK